MFVFYSYHQNNDETIISLDDGEVYTNPFSVAFCEFCDGVNLHLKLLNGDKVLAPRVSRIEILPEPKFFIGDSVWVLTKGNIMKASIVYFFWHYNRKEYVYTITVNGKKKSKRYFGDDLEPVDDART